VVYWHIILPSKFNNEDVEMLVTTMSHGFVASCEDGKKLEISIVNNTNFEDCVTSCSNCGDAIAPNSYRCGT
jgi:hypothetical protein